MNITAIAIALSGSLWQIVLNSSTFGLIILSVLVVMSLVSWVIIFHKWRQFGEVENDNKKFRAQFKRVRSLNEGIGQAKANRRSPMAGIFLAGYQELTELKELKNQGGSMQQSVNKLTDDDFEIVEMGMERALSEHISELEKKVIFLASTANSAPFLGLLGTVVGIMDSFWSIGERGSASLAVVAPGIAEALLATIVGLAAAIPAVIAYNWARNKIKFMNEYATNFMLEFIALAKKEER